MANHNPGRAGHNECRPIKSNFKRLFWIRSATWTDLKDGGLSEGEWDWICFVRIGHLSTTLAAIS